MPGSGVGMCPVRDGAVVRDTAGTAVRLHGRCGALLGG